MKPPSKERLDVLLVEKGLAPDLARARAFIMAGQVLVNNEPMTKAGHQIRRDTPIVMKKMNPYVSRGGLKLEGVLHTLNISVEQKICMDVGASTGGFTDCLLQHGAAKVYAVDVGRHLLHPRLSADPRVINIEGVNYRYFSCESLKEKTEFVTIDVSFISLEKILPAVHQCLTPDGQVLAMVKPQFEALPEETCKGVVKDETVRQRTIQEIKDFAGTLGFVLLGEMDSPVKGPEGNIEHFLWLQNNRNEN